MDGQVDNLMPIAANNGMGGRGMKNTACNFCSGLS